MKIKLIICLCALSTGCATCRDHPVACAAGMALVAGSLKASLSHRDAERPHDVAIGDPYCYGNPRMCE